MVNQNTLDIATQGLLTNESLKIAVQGFLAEIIIEEVPTEEVEQIIVGGGDIISPWPEYTSSIDDRKVYRIKVKVNIRGEEIEKEKYIQHPEKPDVSDVKVSIEETPKPTIIVSFKEKQI